MTRDELIKGLELCITPDPADCADCPVYEDVNRADENPCISCQSVLMREALALLKEELRPLSLEDILHIYHTLGDHVWPYNTPPYLWCEVNRKMYNAFSGWVTWREVMSIIERMVTLRPYSIDNYGELWTLYLRRPD